MEDQGKLSPDYWDCHYSEEESGPRTNVPADFLLCVKQILAATVCKEDVGLVIGCGDSIMSPEIVAAGYHETIHVDFSQVCITAMKAHYPNVCYEIADIRDLRYLDSSFDFILDIATLETLLVGGDLLRKDVAEELRRVLKPRGKVISISEAPHCAREIFTGTKCRLLTSSRVVNLMTHLHGKEERWNFIEEMREIQANTWLSIISKPRHSIWDQDWCCGSFCIDICGSLDGRWFTSLDFSRVDPLAKIATVPRIDLPTLRCTTTKLKILKQNPVTCSRDWIIELIPLAFFEKRYDCAIAKLLEKMGTARPQLSHWYYQADLMFLISLNFGGVLPLQDFHHNIPPAKLIIGALIHGMLSSRLGIAIDPNRKIRRVDQEKYEGFLDEVCADILSLWTRELEHLATMARPLKNLFMQGAEVRLLLEILESDDNVFWCSLAFQDVLATALFKDPHLKKYPLNPAYQNEFLRRLLNRIAEFNVEPHEAFLTAQSRTQYYGKSNIFGPELHYKTFALEERAWTLGGDAKWLVTLRLAETITQALGLKLWPSGLFLAELVHHQARTEQLKPLEGKPAIIELGAGVGFPSIVAGIHGLRVVATGYHAAELEILEENARINNVQHLVEVATLNWEEDKGNLWCCCDKLVSESLALAADCIYCPEIIGPFVNVLKFLIEEKGISKALVAYVKRNEHTFRQFQSTLEGSGLSWKKLELKEIPHILHYSRVGMECLELTRHESINQETG